MGMHAWRQTQTQTNTINFLEEGGSILYPKRNDRGAGDGVFRQEFPLYQWLTAKVYAGIGERPSVMRGVSFALTILTVFGLYFWLARISDDKLIAAITAGAFAFSPTFFYHGFNPMPDNLALCFGAWSLATFQMATIRTSKRWWFLLGLLLAGASLVKLPFILYYALPGGWLLWHRKELGLGQFFTKSALLSLGVVLPAAWYMTVIPEWQGNNIVGGVLSVSYGWSRLFDYFQHNLISTLPELLLNFAAVPAFAYGLYRVVVERTRLYRQYGYFGWLGLALLLFFFYELHALGKAHDYYLYPYLPVIFLVVCFGLVQWGKAQKNKRLKYLLPGLLVLAPLFCFLRMQHAWDPADPGFNPDLYVFREDLRSAVPDDALVITGIDPSPFIYLYYLRKKGWLINNEMTEEAWQKMIADGAKFLYLDTKSLTVKPWMEPYLQREVVKRGSFQVYQLSEPGH